jgi:4-amino-4-deoxy-L-arabinose transferase-like glycosyltransferase
VTGPADRARGLRVDALALAAFAAVPRLVALTRHPLWTDEALTVTVTAWDLPRLLAMLFRVDISPPVHYVYLWAWRHVSDAIWVARLSSVVPGVLSVALLYALGRRLYGRFGGIVAAVLLAVTPLHVYQSDQARYPALITLFAVAAAWALARLAGGERRAAAGVFAASTILMLYTHNFGVLVAVAFFVVSALAHRDAALRRPLHVAWTAIAIAGLAWTPMLVRQLGMRQAAGGGEHVPISLVLPLVGVYFTTGFTDWNLPFFWSRLFLSAGAAGGTPGLMLNAALAAPLFLLAGVGAFARPADGGSTARRLLAPLWFAVPLALFFAASLLLDIYRPYYLLPFLPALLLLAGGGAQALARRSRIAAALATAIVVAIPAGALVDYFRPPVVKEDWPGIARTLAEEGRPGDVVVHLNVASRTCLSFYDDGRLTARHVTEGHPGVHVVGPGMTERLFADLVTRADRVWLVGYYPMRFDPRGLTLARTAGLFELPVRPRFVQDSRFYLRLYATRRDALEREFASAIDFARGEPLPQQLVSGWYPGVGEWRWIGRSATVALRPRPDARRLDVRAMVNLDFLGASPFTLVLACDGEAMGTVRADRSGIVEASVPVPPACLARATVSVTMTADRVFVPDRVLHDGDPSEKSVLVGRVALTGDPVR